jgi:hypothetical protein
MAGNEEAGLLLSIKLYVADLIPDALRLFRLKSWIACRVLNAHHGRPVKLRESFGSLGATRQMQQLTHIPFFFADLNRLQSAMRMKCMFIG